MNDFLKDIPSYVKDIKSIQDIILANIVLIGQIPAPTFHESQRADVFMERLSESQIDECTVDDFYNPIGIIRGSSRSKPPIFLVAHLDTFIDKEVDHNYTIKKNTIMNLLHFCRQLSNHSMKLFISQ